MTEPHRFRPDDLRRLATELLSRAGLRRERASAMGRLLLWYDAAGAHDFGIARLGDWLDRLDRREFDPMQEGRIGPEHASTAVLEASGGLPPLLLARAAEVAGQKARDTGAGIVRVVGLPPAAGPSAAIAAELAIGPFVGAVLGPGPAQAAAIPSAEGIPVVFDSAFNPSGEASSPDPIGPVADRLAPWMLLAGGGDVVVAALAVAAFEPLGSFHRRVAEAIDGKSAPAGWLFPESWDRFRLRAQHDGVPLPGPVAATLRERAAGAGVAFPGPLSPAG